MPEQTNSASPRVRLTDMVSDEILSLLRKDGLSEGDSIPPTVDLATRFGVSRTVVREALAELAGRGFIVRQQGKEGVVALPGGETLASLFESRVTDGAATFEQLHEFREMVEVRAAGLAAERVSLSDAVALSDLLNDMRTAGTDREMLVADVAFHRAIAQIANPFLGLALDGLNPLLMESRLAVWGSYLKHGGRVDKAFRLHAEIRDCIVNRDAQGAVKAMQSDLQDTRKGIQDLR